VLPLKVIWDYAYYWGVLSQLFVHGRLADLRTLSALRDELARCQQLNTEVQRLLRAWGAVSSKHNPAVMLDQAALPWFAELNASLQQPPADEAAFRDRLRQSTQLLRDLASELAARALADHPTLDVQALRGLIGPAPSTAARRLFEAVVD